MSFYERYETLCQERGYSGQSATAFEQIGLKKGTVAGWKKESDALPASKYLIQLSRFFGVSIDYLVCETDIPEKAIRLDAEVQELISNFEECDREGKQIVKAHAIEERRRSKEKTSSTKRAVGK